VVGRGVSLRLQVFKTAGRGWGVRSQEPIFAGRFICEYTGEMFLDADADKHGLEVRSRHPNRARPPLLRSLHPASLRHPLHPAARR
jgi:hypothetical protein